MVERKIRMIFEKHGWKTLRAGASLGPADLICIKKGKCVLLQAKSTKKKKFYNYSHYADSIEGFPLFLVIDFGYGNIRISHPKKTVSAEEGKDLKKFLSDNNPK